MHCAGRWLRVALGLAVALGAACHRSSSQLQTSEGILVFDAPSGGSVSVGQHDPMHLDLDFGQVVSGTSSKVLLSVSNIGGAPVKILSVSATEPDPAFSVGLTAGTVIAPGAAPIQLPIAFQPPALGSRNATFAIATDVADQATITIQMRGAGAPQAISVAPDPLDFGKVLQATSSQAWLSVTNDSDSDHALAALPFTGDHADLFTILDPLPATLSALSTFQFRVDFHAPQTLLGPVTGGLEIDMDCSGCSQTVALTAEAVASCLVVAPGSLEFGVQPSGTSQELSFQISNVANRVVTFTATPSIAQGKDITFFLGAGTPVKFETLGPADTIKVSVVFAPNQAGDFAGIVSIATTDPVATEISLPVHGIGSEQILSCKPSRLDFGEVAFGAPFTHQVVCTNAGPTTSSDPLAIVGTVTGAGFSLIQSGGDQGTSIYPGETAQYLVTLDPQSASVTGSLTIAPRTPFNTPVSIPLTGSGVQLPPCEIQAWPDAGLPFGAIAGGSAFTIPLVLRNVGSSDCLASIGDISFLPPEFSLPATGIASIRLGAVGSVAGLPSEVEIPVQFAPDSPTDPRSAFEAPLFEGIIPLQLSNPNAGLGTLHFDVTGYQLWPTGEPSSAVDFGKVPLGLPPGSCAGATLLATLPGGTVGAMFDSDTDAFSVGNASQTAPYSPLIFRPTQLGRQHLLVLGYTSTAPAAAGVLLAVGEGVLGPCMLPDGGS
jgi:hypothetical protein